MKFEPPPARPVTLTTSDGLALEGEVCAPDGAWAAAVLAHPHPQQGGSMRSIVTGAMFQGLPAAGVAALRFNFRGVEGSEGTHGEGIGERLDLAAAIEALAGEAPGVPLVLAGWSFGADVSLAVGDDRLTGWFCVAPPLRSVPLDQMVAAMDSRPKLLAVPEHDRFRPPDAAREAVAGWANTRVEVVKGADHFLVGRTDRAVDLCVEFLRDLS